MYGAYYPYLYGRGASRSFHHAPHFQYDRFNVGAGGGEAYGGGAAALSTGSSSGAQSPASPPHAHSHAHLAHAHAHAHPAHAPRLRAKEEDLSAHGRASADGNGGSSDSEGECGGAGGGAGAARAQYVSANCVVFTHYSGDVASVVDDHFSRALAHDKPKEAVPMVSRNLPASFFNAGAGVAVGACGVELEYYDPWAQHYGGYGHAAHRHAAEYHAAAQAHHNMAAVGYGGLLRLPQYKDWQPPPPPPHLDPAACAPYSYSGLEAQVQDTSKDLYWF